MSRAALWLGMRATIANAAAIPIDEVHAALAECRRGGDVWLVDVLRMMLELKHGIAALESRNPERWRQVIEASDPRGAP